MQATLQAFNCRV